MASEPNDILMAKQVATYQGEAVYPQHPPFSPEEGVPEYPFARALIAERNPVYRAVRGALHLLGLDIGQFGTPEWNPLGGIVRPGDTVVLKPNFVREFRETQPGHGDCLITHGSVIRAVLDYVHIALKGRGRIVIADAPHNDADFDSVRRIAGLDEIQTFYREHAGVEVEIYDLRPERALKIDGVIVGHEPLPGDPAGYVKIDLGRHSMFDEIQSSCNLLYGSEYDTAEVRCHHTGGTHEYLISKSILDADVVISLPKLKTHKKVGLTVNLKNLVGINGNKNWLPHHREGTPKQGGDQFPVSGAKQKLERAVVAKFKRVFPFLGPLRRLVAAPIKAMGKRIFGDTNLDTIRSGNWYGNDTTWRMCTDLNRILVYADSTGILHDKPIRGFFSVVDGIIGGEGNGPLDPYPRPVGVVVAGANPVSVDLLCARLMGFNYEALPLLHGALGKHARPLTKFEAADVEAISNRSTFSGWLRELTGPMLEFEPHFGWKGHVEWRQEQDTDGTANRSPDRCQNG